MTSRTHRFFPFFLCVLSLFLLLCACSASHGGTPAKTDGMQDSPACTLTILCDTALSSPDCDPDILSLLPGDGTILAETAVSFTEGESVLDLLLRVCREKKIHFEYSETPLYHAAYLEGISNLYEFDCGSLSGWMYSINGVYPPLSCSQCFPADGDRILVRYTCALGEDIGGSYSEQRADTPAA